MTEVDRFFGGLNADIEDATEEMLESLAREALSTLQAVAPVRTGRLKRSGRAFVNGKLVARSGMADARFSSTENYKIKAGRQTLTVIFSTPKEATPNAQVYYTESGRKLFDYAYKAFGFYGLPLLHALFRAPRLKRELAGRLRTKWSRRR